MKPLETKNLKLIPQTREGALAEYRQYPPEVKAQVSPVWLAMVEASAPVDPWIHGFKVRHRITDSAVGTCGFKAPPDDEGMVEIAYGVDEAYRGKGYATEAAAALTKYAMESGAVRLVRAHTLPEPNASTRVLTKCGFRKIGEVIDPEDGPVWRWETTGS
jgi:[ribosomal protein S5]-alanine N-acetyltransferase